MAVQQSFMGGMGDSSSMVDIGGGTATPQGSTFMNKWNEMSPDSKFNMISALAGRMENQQAVNQQNRMAAVNALATPYVGREVQQVQMPSITNTIYAYKLAEDKRRQAEEASKFRENLMSRYASMLELEKGK